MDSDLSLISKVHECVAFTSDVIDIAQQAGAIIVEHAGASATLKSDQSPVTAADQAAHHYIEKKLSLLVPHWPVLSEESGKQAPYSIRKNWQTFWMVDPLDGTKEFIAGSGEYTVNIALIHEGKPIFGVVYAPVLQQLYYAQYQQGAWRRVGNGEPEKIKVNPSSHQQYRVVASKSHLCAATRQYIKKLASTGKQVELLQSGSSLKFMRVAEGAADCYPRFGPTMEWDTAAAHLIAAEAGANIISVDGKPLVYNKQDLHNPGFVVTVPDHVGSLKLL